MASLYEHVARGLLHLRGFETRFVPTPVGPVHVLIGEQRGEGPDLVLLHGLSAAGVHFLPILRHLRPHVARLIIPDMPAHGFSDPPRGAITHENMREGLFSALDACLDRPAVLFGNSLGGFASIHYALARPHKVRGLALCSPAGAAMDDSELASLVQIFRMKTHSEALEFLDRLFAARPPLRHILAWQVRRNLARKEMRELLVTAEQGRSLLLTPEQLAALTMPVLLLWGRSERILTARQREFFRSHLPRHARFEEPEGFGHSPFLERPRAVSAILRRFLSELDRDASFAFAS